MSQKKVDFIINNTYFLKDVLLNNKHLRTKLYKLIKTEVKSEKEVVKEKVPHYWGNPLKEQLDE
uniref:Uncharacterized protein n=1 Tax=viral metagenome TaxID=1070528 RepID=A0A6C0F670_9ZZZZ|tara:strand:- start:5187 stop:5378 length:192 start_codon:yes stop_codon:yes gene_type:complete